MVKGKTTVHTTVIARELKQQVGVAYMTQMFNNFKAKYGVNASQRAPVKRKTVVRYTNLGQGYEVAPPMMFRRFCLSRISKKF